MDFKQDSEPKRRPKRRRLPEEVKLSVRRRKTTKKVTRKILPKKHAKDGTRKKRVRKKKHSDSAILRRKQKRQLQAAFRTIREYQSETSVRKPHPHGGHLQLETNNFSERVPPTNPQMDFQPPDTTMVRERRAWHSEPHPEAFSQRHLKNHRRRKSHLDDVYGPNFEEFKEREYHKGRYGKWDQPGYRNSTSRSIKRTHLKRIECGNESEKDISSRSAMFSDIKKQSVLSTDNNKNKNNSNEGCDNKRSTNIPEKSNSTNSTNVSDKAITKKNCDDKMMKTPELDTEKYDSNLEKIKPSTEKTAKCVDHDLADVEKVSKSLPVPLDTMGKVCSMRQLTNSSSKVSKIEGNEQKFPQNNDLKRTNIKIDHITENSLVPCEKDIELDDGTVLCNDFISIDKIDTTKSFLECFPADDYRVLDMDVDSPSPKKTKTGTSNNLTESQCKNVYPEINCDQLLNELNKALENDCNNIVNNADKEKASEKTDSKIKPCSKKEHSKRKLEKHRSDKKNDVEKIKSTSNKMSSVFYPGLANYTIPKRITKKKIRFSDIDEPYMNKMQSLFGVEAKNEDQQKLAESMNDNKVASKKSHKKRLSTTDEGHPHIKKICTDTKTPKSSDEGHSQIKKLCTDTTTPKSSDEGHPQIKKICTDTKSPKSSDEGHSQIKKICTDNKTSKSSRGSVERHMKRSSKVVEEKSKTSKNLKRIMDNSKISISTNAKKCKANVGKRNKTNQGYESKESIKLSKESTESNNQRESLTKTVRKTEANNAKQATDNTNAVEKKSCHKHIKIMDNKRRNSETPSSNTKLVTKRRNSLQLHSSTDGRQNDKFLEKSQTKKVSKNKDIKNDTTKPLEKHSDKTDMQVTPICDTNNPKYQLEKVIAQHYAIIDKSKELTVANGQLPSVDSTMKQMKSKTDLDEISSALSKIFECETPTVESSATSMISSDKESTSELTPNGISSLLKHLQEPLIEEKESNTSLRQPENTSKKTTNDVATISDKLPSKPLEIGGMKHLQKPLIEEKESNISLRQPENTSKKTTNDVATTSCKLPSKPLEIGGMKHLQKPLIEEKESSTSLRQPENTSKKTTHEVATTSDKLLSKPLEIGGMKHLQKPLIEEKESSTSLRQPENTSKKTTHEVATTSGKLPRKPLEIGGMKHLQKPLIEEKESSTSLRQPENTSKKTTHEVATTSDKLPSKPLEIGEIKHLQEPMIEEKESNTFLRQPENTRQKRTHDVATTSGKLPSKPLEIGGTSSKCLNSYADLGSTSPAHEIDKTTESSEKMPSDIAGSFVTTFKISNSNNDEDTDVAKPTTNVQDKSNSIDQKPIIGSIDDKKLILPTLKLPLLVKTALKSELFSTSECCSPLAGLSLPQLHRVQNYMIVLSDCNERVTTMESPDVIQSVGLIRNETCSAVVEIIEEISDNDDPLDDVIEIKPNIPVIDLTKDSSDVSTAKLDSKADLLGLLEEGFDRREKITIYRSDETSNNALEVQAMSASIAPINILGANTPEGIKPDIDDNIVTVAKVEPNVVGEPCVSESNQNADSNGDTVSLAFAHNVRALISQLEDSDSHADSSAEISRNEDSVTQQESTETLERPAVEIVPVVEKFRQEPIIPDKSNDELFIYPESVDQTQKKSTRKKNSRWSSQPNILTSNDTQTTSLQATNQIVGQKENNVNPMSHLTRFVFPNSPHGNAQESRLNDAQVMGSVMRNAETNQLSQSHSNPSIFNSQNAGMVQPNRADFHFTQQEYSVTNAIVPYIHLMACIRRNQANHSEFLRNNLSFLPELLKIELKLGEHIYMNKLQIYSGYMVNRLKLLDLSRNMTSATAHATIEYIFQTVRCVNKSFTKTGTILFLEHLMKPHEAFYGSSQYLKSFYSLVKVFCMEIVRRAAMSSDSPPSLQMTPSQRKILEYQIQQWQKIVNTEKCKQLRNERLNRSKNQPVTEEITLNSLLNSRPVQTNCSKNRVAERTSQSKSYDANEGQIGSISSFLANLPVAFRSPTHRPEGFMSSPAERTSQSKSYDANEGQTGSITSFLANLPVAFRSPTHRPEGFMNSPAHVSDESNIIPMNGVDFNYPARLSTTARSPAHRSDGIFMPLPGTFRSPAHIPEQLTATLRSPIRRNEDIELPAFSTVANHSSTRTVHFPEMQRSPAHKPNNASSMTVRSLVHRPPPPSYSVHSNSNQPSNTTPNSLQCLNQNVSVHVPEASSYVAAYSNTNITNQSTVVLRSPAHRLESVSSSPSHFPAVNGSPAHRSGRPMNSPSRFSTVAQSPVHQSGSQHEFVVPRKPPNKPKTINSPPVSSLIHMSPSRSVCQNSPVHTQFTNVPSMSPDQTSSVNVPMSDSSNEASPRTSNVAFSPRDTHAAATPSRSAMPNLINIRSPVYAPMLFSPQNFIQDEPDDPLDADEEASQNDCGKESRNEDTLETIDLTWLDDVDDEQIQKEIDFIAVKKEEPDDGEVILNQEQFPVVPSPADSGIASPSHQEECSELVYLHRLCICEGPAEYLCKCRMVMYCSPSCQARDWKDHKIVCLKYTIRNKDK